MLTLLLEVAILLKYDFFCDTNNTGKNTRQDTENSFPSHFNTASKTKKKKNQNQVSICAFLATVGLQRLTGFQSIVAALFHHDHSTKRVNSSSDYLLSLQFLNKDQQVHQSCFATISHGTLHWVRPNHLTIFI